MTIYRIFMAICASGMLMTSGGAALSKDHAVTISGFKFTPARISVAAGDTITFTNNDSAPHTATALNGAFNTGTIGKGKSKKVTVNNAGGLDYKCNFHPAMKGKVTAK